MIVGGEKKPAQMRAFNTRFCIIIPFIVMLVYALILLDKFSTAWFAALAILTIAVVCLLLEPLYYVFSKKELLCVFVFGYRKHLLWQNVGTVRKWRSYEIFSFPKGHYTVYYGEVFRGRYVQQHMDLPITRRIKDCFKKYYPGSVQGEDTPKKKRKK